MQSGLQSEKKDKNNMKHREKKEKHKWTKMNIIYLMCSNKSQET